jgi:hypothetical protein
MGQEIPFVEEQKKNDWNCALFFLLTGVLI